MGTRSTISIENDDGTVTGVYCHWDGYISHNGRILQEHYNTDELAQALIAGGDISSLGEQIGEEHPFDNPHEFGSDEYRAHQERHRGWTTYYGRDRGETGVEAQTQPTLAAFMEAQSQEFNYHRRQGRWYVSEDGARFVRLAPLLEDAFEV